LVAPDARKIQLIDSINDLLDTVNRGRQLVFTFNHNCDCEKFPSKLKLMIFRIIQEQSNNIIKYSRAADATFALTEKDNQCNLVISDNGIGFDKTKQKANGIGFINIFNRIDAYNGKVEIITYPDNGCMLNISMPYVV